MSMSKVRSYFEAVAKGLDYKVSGDAFTEKLPTQGGKFCFIELGKPSLQKNDQSTADFKAQVTVKLFVTKGLNTVDVEKKTYEATEAFLTEAMKLRPSADFNYLNLNSYDVERLSNGNDTVMQGVIEFETVFVLGF